jgi:hypothetical protein
MPSHFITRGCVTLCGLAIYIKKKSILRQKKTYYDENSNISSYKKYIIFQKSSNRNQNPSRYYYYSKFQHKPKYHLSKILVSKNKIK